MFENKINIKKIDVYSFFSVLIIFLLDRFSKIYVIDLIQSQGGEIFLDHF
tara:strand:+ start:1018 stop:1167 length:150 start_codon:yes stop_codon:yes gene_type:complete